MKAFFSLVVVAVALFFVVGCSTLSPNAVSDNQSSSVGKIVNFVANFNDSSALAKIANLGDSLTFQERKDLRGYHKARITMLEIRMTKVGGGNESTMAADYVFLLPVKNGLCSGGGIVDSGSYIVNAFDYGTIKAGPDSMHTFDFQVQTRINVGASDTTAVSLALETNYYFPAIIQIVDSGVSFNGVLDSVFDQRVIGGGSSHPKITNGYVEAMEVYSVKKNFSFFFNGKKYSGLFDVTKVMDNNVIEVSVTEVKQTAASMSISFVDDAPFAITNFYPKAGDTIQVADSVAIPEMWVSFNHDLASSDEMLKLVIKVEEVNDTVRVITPTTEGTIVQTSIGVGDKGIYTFPILKPNKRYICRISGVVDEFGNVLAEGARWMFTTKA